MRELYLKGPDSKLPKGAADRRSFHRNVQAKLIQRIHRLLQPYPRPFLHHIRVGSFACELARALALKLGFTNSQVQEIVAAAVTHDIGKTHEDTQHFFDTHQLKYPRKFLNRLNKLHQKKGYDMLGAVKLGGLEQFRYSMQMVALLHHTQTRRLRRMSIDTPTCLWALHITRVTDAFDAATAGETERAYKTRRQTPDQVARSLLIGAQKGLYEPLVVETWIRDCLHKDPNRLLSRKKK